jgi:microsomal dipeptidase-like Zn-dependent dipeptidase
VVRVGHARDIERARAEGKPGVVYHMAGVGGFAEAAEPIWRLDLFFGLGVRVMQLTYIQQNKLCSSWLQGDDDTGLTDLDAVMRQAYAAGVQRPAKPGSRNASDEILRALAATAGVAAFYTIDYVLGLGDHAKTFGCFAQHLEHALGVAGADHVAIGTDRTHFPDWPPTSMDWTNWPYWTVGLVCRGWTDDQIRNVIGANFLRLAQGVLDRQPWGPFI